MNCSRVIKNMSSYLDGELGHEEHAELKSHLATCARCAAELQRMRELHDCFVQAPRYSALPGFRNKVMERIAEQATAVFVWRRAAVLCAEAFVCLLVLAAGVISGNIMIQSISPSHQGNQIVSSLALETFSTHPPASLGSAYLTMTEVRQ
jgi:anti-sigma factor RsiW